MTVTILHIKKILLNKGSLKDAARITGENKTKKLTFIMHT